MKVVAGLQKGQENMKIREEKHPAKPYKNALKTEAKARVRPAPIFVRPAPNSIRPTVSLSVHGYVCMGV